MTAITPAATTADTTTVTTQQKQQGHKSLPKGKTSEQQKHSDYMDLVKDYREQTTPSWKHIGVANYNPNEFDKYAVDDPEFATDVMEYLYKENEKLKKCIEKPELQIEIKQRKKHA